MQRETIHLKHSEFFTGGPEVNIDVEQWNCDCRTWPIVTASTTQSTKDHEAWPKREAWFVRSCRNCGIEPRPDRLIVSELPRDLWDD